MVEVEKILTAYLTDASREIVRNYKLMGLRASGKFERSIEIKTQQPGEGVIRAWIESAGHAYFMSEGRKPNKEKTVEQARALGHILEQWVKDKGIDVNPYAAAWKIVREGITVPNSHNAGGVISSVINDNWFKELFEELREAYKEDITLEVTNLFKYGRYDS